MEALQTRGGEAPHLFRRVSKPPGAAQTPSIDDAQVLHRQPKNMALSDGKKESGFVCGGEQPLGIAVTYVVQKLQELDALTFAVTFVDEEGVVRGRLSCGDVRGMSVEANPY